MRNRRSSKQRGFTLVEVMIAAVITLILTLMITGGIMYVQRAQKIARERSQAHREAAKLIEEARRLPFNLLLPVDKQVDIDDNRTPADDTDDVEGRGVLTLQRVSDGTMLTSAAGEDYIRVQATVTWRSAGDPEERLRQVTMVTEFAP